MYGKHWIDGKWILGTGELFSSENPATGEIIWQGYSALAKEVEEAVKAAQKSFLSWANASIEERLIPLERFTKIIQEEYALLVETIAKETGKPIWDASIEVKSMISKLSISVEAYHDRCREMKHNISSGLSITRHKPQGVIAVFGPFNFPGHLPNGHIVPALLAGNTIIFKPSELTPLVAEKMMECWQKADLPPGVINMVQGGRETGEWLSKNSQLDGLFFTGSFKTGQILNQSFAKSPEKILALEMGGNNPLVVCNIRNIPAAIYHILQSAYLSSGQRCTCARRLIIVKEKNKETFQKSFLDALIDAIQTLKVGAYTESPEPFMGPVISNEALQHILTAYESLLHQGAKILVPLKRLHKERPFLSPGLLDVTDIIVPDEEIFGPLLQLRWVEDFDTALLEANRTVYGLAAGILTDDEKYYRQFRSCIKAGIINWNRALTGASSHAPFGGVGHSGNHRPSAYYAADYCAYPVASLEAKTLALPSHLPPGLTI